MIDNRHNLDTIKQENSVIQRHDLINHLIAQHQYKTYLEIGIFNGYTFQNVNCELKHGVEPGKEGLVIPQVTHRMTSDQFFENCNENYDIILIDGLHEYLQVIKDFNNSLRHINPNGHILFHDCNPVDELSQRVPRESISWNGDVWKAFVLIRSNNPHAFVYDTDYGIGVVKNDRPLTLVINSQLNIDWDFFNKNRHNLLGLVPVDFSKT